jgi:hypothetical protein
VLLCQVRFRGRKPAADSPRLSTIRGTISTKVKLRDLMNLSGQWVDRAHRHRELTQLILDMDSSVSETYGHYTRRAAPTTATSAVPGTTPSSCSTSSVSRARVAAAGQLGQRQVLTARAAVGDRTLPR